MIPPASDRARMIEANLDFTVTKVGEQRHTIVGDAYHQYPAGEVQIDTKTSRETVMTFHCKAVGPRFTYGGNRQSFPATFATLREHLGAFFSDLGPDPEILRE